MHILHIISSPRSNSYSARLGHQIVEKLLAAHPGSTVHERDLTVHPLPHLEEVFVRGIFTPDEARTPEQKSAVQHSDEVISEVLAADVLVIGSPMYNFSISSSLKAWLDHLVRAGVTFLYGANGPQGLLTGKKVYLALASGGVYSEGSPMAAYDFMAPYLKPVLAFIGLTDVEVVRVEGTSIPELEPTALDKALASVEV
ncbi:FMN-dependent NADH-azoreductase [Hymenobacter negativus]|uniref:FMN dependent NADH:quinone oxidoreductase n=1 Tax=Hymenobacter negativus TaxID=2795026 RepID=A0ABS3QJC9_9BACT|nr:NAD(P)H-dependent oxidoreductase [Hymenobacter negativus]MBO2011093.1 NAD(P)H-dependent oxidoreductase [Hymenobacter negativus]